MLRPPLHIPRIGPFLPVLEIFLIPVFFPRVGPKKRLARVVPGLLPGYSGVIPCKDVLFEWIRESSHPKMSPYSSILSALTRIKPCCSRVVPVLFPCCSRVAPVLLPCYSRVAQYCPVLPRVALYIPVLIQVIPVLFLGYYYAFFQHGD